MLEGAVVETFLSSDGSKVGTISTHQAVVINALEQHSRATHTHPRDRKSIRVMHQETFI